MTYLMVMLITVSIYYKIENLKKNRYVVLIFLGLIWLIVMGSQFNPNSDYIVYKIIYENDPNFFGSVKKEFGFHYIIQLAKTLGSAQYIFIFISIIQIAFTFLIFEKYKKIGFSHLYLFVFVYFSMSGIFQNQLGFLRSFTSILIFNYALFSIMEKKFLKWTILILTASLFHLSSLFFFPLYFLRRLLFRRFNNKIYYFFIIFPLSTLVLKDFYLIIFSNLIPSVYRNYLTVEVIIPLFTKAILIPLYILSVKKISTLEYNKKQLFFINTAYLTCNIHFFAYAMPILARLLQFGDLIRCLPVYLLLKFYKKNNSIIFFILIIGYLLLPYILKVTIFAVGPYKYDSFLYHIDKFP